MAVSRVWRGWAARARASEYESLVAGEVLPAMEGLAGFRGATLLRREAGGDEVEFLVVTEWDSVEAIRGFAGAEPERATIPPRAAALLRRYDERAAHYERVWGAGG